MAMIDDLIYEHLPQDVLDYHKGEALSAAPILDYLPHDYMKVYAALDSGSRGDGPSTPEAISDILGWSGDLGRKRVIRAVSYINGTYAGQDLLIRSNLRRGKGSLMYRLVRPKEYERLSDMLIRPYGILNEYLSIGDFSKRTGIRQKVSEKLGDVDEDLYLLALSEMINDNLRKGGFTYFDITSDASLRAILPDPIDPLLVDAVKVNFLSLLFFDGAMESSMFWQAYDQIRHGDHLEWSFAAYVSHPRLIAVCNRFEAYSQHPSIAA